MEQDFNDLALAKFLQGSPELGNLILSFKDVTDDLQNESDIRVGIFILRSGEDVFYVPVVSKMDNIYPIDSIFWASKGKFFPLTKKTIALVINSSQMSQGKGRKMPSTVVTNPDVTHLINPPRTGKYVAASTSRLGDFMAALPNYLKDFALEKISSERSVYENLHKLFSIKDIFSALKPAPQSMAAETNSAPISIVTGAATELTGDEIAAILDKGYAVRGASTAPRFAVSSQNYEDNNFTQVTELDGNTDYDIMFSRGNSREAFIPKINSLGHVPKRSSIALFTNGDYAIADTFVAQGTKLDRRTVLDTIFNYNPPVLPRDVMVDDCFAIIDNEGSVLGIFEARKVTLSHLGVEIDTYCRAGAVNGGARLFAYRNYGHGTPMIEGRDIYMNYSTLILKLGSDVSMDLERTVDSASKKYEITQGSILGDQLNLGFDGVEFSINGKVVGQEKEAMQRLVVAESIDPTVACTFIKQAKDNKITRIYLSKQADAGFRAGEIPQFGEQPAPQQKTGLNGSFIPNVQQSLSIGDSQSTEATIISELLQAPDMYELIEEYLPDIEESIDRLGRIMFLSRVHITQLSENNDTDSVFAFLAQLKAVYRMLGDNFIKLQEMLALRPNEKNNG